MSHVPQLITDLALLLGVAAIVSVVFRWLKQPVVLGYILAGFLISPQATWLPSVTEKSGLNIWSEIGVIFLLFGLGLEFSFRKLFRVGAAAAIAAFIEVFGMMGLGYGIAKLMDWSDTDALFLGGVLAISSTTIIVRAFDELGLKSRSFVQLVFGILIIEDLFAVLLLVLLSTIATGRGFEGEALLYESLKLGFFLTVWFVGGLFALPPLLKKIRPWFSDEMALVTSVALCFGMVLLSSAAGLSPALGAFVMGSLLAETSEGHRIEKVLQPVKDLFAAVFFVSVGMLIDLAIIQKEWPTILLFSFVTIMGKVLTTGGGALLSGQSLKSSVRVGFSLAQIGEFSFIIASLGVTLGVTSARLYPIAVAISAITTLATPYLIRSSESVSLRLERAMPHRWRQALERYSASWQRLEATKQWKVFLRERAFRVGTSLAVAVALILLASRGLRPWMTEAFGAGRGPVLAASLGALFALPFLWAVARGGGGFHGERKYWRQLRGLGPLGMVELLRLVIAGGLVGFFIGEFDLLDAGWASMGLLAIAMLIFFAGPAERAYAWCESTFFSNLAQPAAVEERPPPPPLAPWDAHVVTVEVAPESNVVGRSLIELGVRERFGVTIALIERGRLRLTAPGRDEKLFPGDRLAVIGTDDQIEKLRSFLASSATLVARNAGGEFRLTSFILEDGSPYVGASIRESGLREATEGLVVGIERAGQRFLNPDSNLRFQPGDLVWLVGDAEKIRVSLNRARPA